MKAFECSRSLYPHTEGIEHRIVIASDEQEACARYHQAEQMNRLSDMWRISCKEVPPSEHTARCR